MPAPPLPEETRRQIRETVISCGGNKAEAARRLSLDRGTVNKYAGDVGGATFRIVDPIIGPDSSARPDTTAIVAELLRQIEAKGLVGPPETIAPAAQPQEPVRFEPPGRTRLVDIGRKYERIAWISDLHHPFLDRISFTVAVSALRDYCPDLLIIGGDGFDCFSISDHDREPGRADFLQDEFDAAQPTWRELDDLGCDVIFLKGNHEERIDRIQRRNPGLFKLRSLELAIAADLPKRWMVYPDQTRLRIGSLTALHGNLKGRGTASVHAAAGMLNKLRTTCIFGHLHRFQTFMQTGNDGTVRAGYANGHLSDVDEAHYITAPDWQSGFSCVDYDWSAGIFNVTPHLIVNGKTRIGGKTYA